MKKAFIPLAILVILILVFTGCGKATTTSTTAPSTTPSIQPPVSSATATSATTTASPTAAIKKGGTLRWLTSLGPQSAPGWPGDTANFQKLWACYTVFEGLVKQDGGGLPIPYLATKWDWAADKSSITFTLRQGVKFSDGTPLTQQPSNLISTS
jgi:ABC-type transport system substrate-binding protein